MDPELADALCCPACRAGLRLRAFRRDAAGDVLSGELGCDGCGARYPISGGIADFLGPPRPATITQLINELPPAAWAYERLWRPFALTMLSGEPFPYSRELPMIVEMAAPERGGLFVDVACSVGLYARALARAMRGAGGIVVGVDHSMPMLREARRWALREGLRVSYLRARAQALPVRAAAAAGVTIGGSLNEIGDLDACLAEVRRALAPAGHHAMMSLVQAGTRAGRVVQRLMAPGGVRFLPAAELARRYEHHGLLVVGSEQHGIVLFLHCRPAT